MCGKRKLNLRFGLEVCWLESETRSVIDFALISLAISMAWLSSFSSFTEIGLTVLVFFLLDLVPPLLLLIVPELELFFRFNLDDNCSVSSFLLLVFSTSGESGG